MKKKPLDSAFVEKQIQKPAIEQLFLLSTFRLLLVLVSLQRSSSGHKNDAKQVLLFGRPQTHGGYRQVND